ncbi:MAG: GntR family transcriptional regulator [Chloroflexi bacterium RBG_16_70_13]|nr:MAG: GntR family transcriptional regulator [Chloroflexi bacterium RBG_16_70_13]
MTDDGGISRSVLAEQVKDRLLQDILSGRYPSHSRIVETRVARELGTSQAPVREALRGLEALGVIEIHPFRGARVRHPSRGELLEAYAVRAELEALGARLGVPRMSDADLAEIEALLAAMEQAADGGDRHEVAVADATFHSRLLKLAGNATLERVWRSLEPFSRTYITLVAPGADTHWTAGLHPGIVEALRTRDPERVVAALRDHFDRASAHLAEGWQDDEAEAEAAPRTASRPR